jgi:hypothetical protein
MLVPLAFDYDQKELTAEILVHGKGSSSPLMLTVGRGSRVNLHIRFKLLRGGTELSTCISLTLFDRLSTNVFHGALR